MTNEHREQAREIALETVQRYLPDESPYVGRGRRCEEFLSYRIAAVLSARDQEIKEVLEGLSDDGCFDACFLRWMKRYEDSDGFEHSTACLAARKVWEKVKDVA